MKAIYDLSQNPATWDFATALASFELERIRRGEDSIDLFITPGADHGFRPAPTPPRSVEDREQMLLDVVIAMTHCVPSVRKTTVAGTPAGLERYFGFGKYTIGLHKHLDVLKSDQGRCFKLTAPQRYENVITITLRECAYHPGRNSNMDSWLAVAEHIERDGYTPIFVRDHRNADAPIGGFETDPVASTHISARGRLYASAKLNLFVTNGPMVLAQLGNQPFLEFWKTEPTHGASGLAHYSNAGMEKGQNWPNSPPWQRRSWIGDDDPHAMIREIDAMLEVVS